MISLTGCAQDQPELEILNVTDEEMEQDARDIRENVSITIEDGFDLTLWASEKLLGDMIALDMDNQGRAWVTVTNRSRDSEIDIRDVDESWLMETIKLESVEDRRAFLHRELTPERSEEHTWITDYNEDGIRDWKDLAVMQEEVYRVEDLTGNGMANQSQLFIRDFNEEITDVAGAIVYHEDNVFLGVGPDMWRLQDTDGDGMSDVKESISHGYNVHIGFSGHGMSGAKVGPDGRIYWGIGDMGINIVDSEGNEWYYPNQGTILRSEPDGSNFEVYAAGVRNTHEFDFDKYGNLISVDNDGDHAGEYERLVHLVNGSDSGWRTNWQFGKYTDPKNNDYKVWMDETYYFPRFDEQAAHVLPPVAEYHAGPAGFAYNPGTALNDNWGEHFFVMSFRGAPERSAIHGFSLKEKGASFELETDQEILRGTLAVGMDFGPDGALYLTDWIQGWGTKDNGRIWKLDTPDNIGSSLRAETKELLAEDFNDRNEGDLINLLGHQDMRVRQKAQFELAGRGDTATLLAAIEDSDNQMTRIHAIWGLAQIGRRNIEAVDPLIQVLSDSDSEIRAQAAKMLGDVRYEAAGDPLIPLLGDDAPRVRFFAAEALGRIEYQTAFQPVVDMLEDNDDEDIYLRQAGAIALSRLNDGESTVSLADHPSRAVRIAAVVALKRMENPGVRRFLQDEDEYIVTNAARAISDDVFLEEALPDLARILDQNVFVNEPLIRRAINANLYSGSVEDAQRLASFALRSDIPEVLRVESIKTLGSWNDPSIFDRVTGRHRGEIDNDPAAPGEAFGPLVDELSSANGSAFKIAILESITTLSYGQALPTVFDLLQNDSSNEVRMASLNTLHSLNYDQLEDAVAIALDDDQSNVRMNALRMIPDTELPEESIVNLLVTVLDNGNITEQKTAMQTLGSVDNNAAHEVLNNQLELLIERDLPGELHLELIEAVEEADNSILNSLLERYFSSLPQDDKLAAYESSLRGGDAEAGRRIFYQNDAAQCIRCHTVNEEGSNVGPDLTDAGSRLSREQLLEAMVDPNARTSPGFGTVSLVLENGESINGMLEEETSTFITVSTNDGKNKRVQVTEIVERTDSPSAMPDMSNALSRRELRDLVEYLSTLNGLNKLKE